LKVLFGSFLDVFPGFAVFLKESSLFTRPVVAASKLRHKQLYLRPDSRELLNGAGL
jgi:hypothetical protein